MNLTTVQCIKCKEVLPQTVEYFYKNGSENKFKGKCKECYKKDVKNRKTELHARGICIVNPESKKKSQQKYYQKNKERLQKYGREYGKEYNRKKREERKKELEQLEQKNE